MLDLLECDRYQAALERPGYLKMKRFTTPSGDLIAGFQITEDVGQRTGRQRGVLSDLLMCVVVAASRPPRLLGEIWISKRPNPRLRRWSDQVILEGVGAVNVDAGYFLRVDDNGNHDSLKYRVAYDQRLEIKRILPLES